MLPGRPNRMATSLVTFHTPTTCSETPPFSYLDHPPGLSLRSVWAISRLLQPSRKPSISVFLEIEDRSFANIKLDILEVNRVARRPGSVAARQPRRSRAGRRRYRSGESISGPCDASTP